MTLGIGGGSTFCVTPALTAAWNPDISWTSSKAAKWASLQAFSVPLRRRCPGIMCDSVMLELMSRGATGLS